MNLETVKYLMKNPKRLFTLLGSKGFLDWLPDEQYIRIQFKIAAGYPLNLENPKTFNEKLQWLKLHDRKPLYTQIADKYAVRQYISEKIGEEYLIPLVGGPWNSAEEIDFYALPEQFVLKCNHDRGGIVFCRDRGSFDYEKAKAYLNKRLKRNHWRLCREWPYKNIKPCIIAEKYMEDSSNVNLNVYKFLCFDGEPKIIQTIQNDKTAYESIDYFDLDWNLLELRQNYPNSEHPLKKPELLEDMVAISRMLCEGFPFIRSDLYEINGRVYFSELTFYSDNGTAAFDPPAWDEILGSWITLPRD